MRVNRLRGARTTVTQTLLPNLQRSTEPVLHRSVRVPERMEAVALGDLNPQTVEQRLELSL